MNQEEIKLQVIKECANDLIHFGRVISPQTFYLGTPKFHYEIAELLMDRSKKQIAVEAPRGFSKSTLCSFFVLHHCLYDPGDKLVVIQSKTQREAKRRLGKIKNILDYGTEFKQIYGYFGEVSARIWREDEISVSTPYGNWTISAKGTGQQVRGMNEDDTRITLYYLDDPDDEDNCKTKEAMEDNYSKFAGGVRGLDRRTGRCAAVGTPIVEGCIIARLMGSEGWDTLHFSACDEETKEVLWKEMKTYEELMAIKSELDSQGFLWKFYSEYQCVLKGKDDQVFKPEDFRYYDGEFKKGSGTEHYVLIKGIYDEKKRPLELYDDPLVVPILTFIGVDPSFSLNPKADYSVTMPIGIDKDWNVYQFPYSRKRVLTSELVEVITQFHSIYSPARTTIESGAQQDSIRQMTNLLQDKHIVGLASKVAAPKDSKNKRYIDILQYYHHAHKLFLDINSSEELKSEMILHPSTTMHDDTIDGLYWAVKRAYTPDHTVVKEETDEMKYYLRQRQPNKSWQRV